MDTIQKEAAQNIYLRQANPLDLRFLLDGAFLSLEDRQFPHQLNRGLS